MEGLDADVNLQSKVWFKLAYIQLLNLDVT